MAVFFQVIDAPVLLAVLLIATLLLLPPQVLQTLHLPSPWVLVECSRRHNHPEQGRPLTQERASSPAPARGPSSSSSQTRSPSTAAAALAGAHNIVNTCQRTRGCGRASTQRRRGASDSSKASQVDWGADCKGRTVDCISGYRWVLGCTLRAGGQEEIEAARGSRGPSTCGYIEYTHMHAQPHRNVHRPTRAHICR